MDGSRKARLAAVAALTLVGGLAAATAVDQPRIAHPAVERQAAATARIDLVGQIGGVPSDLVVADGRAYMAVGARVWVADVTDWAAPRLVAMSPTYPERVAAVRVVGARVVAVIADPFRRHEAAISVLESSGQRVLRELGRLQLDMNGVWAVAVDGTRVVLVGHPHPETQAYPARLIDVADPGTMAAQQLDLGLDATAIRYQGMTFVDHYLYVFGDTSAPTGPLLQIYDLSESPAARIVGRAALNGAYPVVVGRQLYLLDVGDPDAVVLQAVDVGDPLRPSLLSATRVSAVSPDKLAALTVAGGYAFVLGQEGQTVVLDVSDPSMPKPWNASDAGHPITAAMAVERRLYVAGAGQGDHRSGLEIVDLTQPAAARTLGQLAVLPPRITGVTVADGFAYVTASGPNHADSSALWAVDVSDPANPWPVNVLDRPVGLSPAARDGHFLYLANGGVDVVDLSTPGQPRLRGSTSEPAVTDVKSVVAGQGRAYVTSRPGVGEIPLQVIDTSDPDHPRLLAELAIPNTPISPIAFSPLGSLLFGAVWNGELVRVDIRDPLRMLLARRGSPDQYVTDVALDSRYAVVASRNRLQLFDVATLVNLRELASLPIEGFYDGKVALAGDLVWAGDNWRLLQAIEIAGGQGGPAANWAGALGPSDGAAIVATFTLPYLADTLDRGVVVEDLASVGELTFVATGDSGLIIVRLDDPAHSPPTPEPAPTLVPRAEHSVYLPATFRSGYAGQRSGALTQLGQWQGIAYGLAMAIDGHTLLTVGDCAPGMPNAGSGCLVAVDFVQPDHPYLAGRSDSLAPTGEPPNATTHSAPQANFDPNNRSLAVRGDIAYVPYGSGLAVVDVHDLTRPRVIKRLLTEGEPDFGVWQGITLAGDRAYLQGLDRVRILDVTDPAAPRPLGGVHVVGSGEMSLIYDTAPLGDHLLVAMRSVNGTGGLLVVDARNPMEPKNIDKLLDGQSWAAVATDGRRAYVAPYVPLIDEPGDEPDPGLTGGVVVMDFTELSRPQQLGYRLDHDVGAVYAIAPAGPDLVMLGTQRGVRLWDTSDTAFPHELASLGTTDLGDVARLVIDGAIAYANSPGRGITAIRSSMGRP